MLGKMGKEGNLGTWPYFPRFPNFPHFLVFLLALCLYLFTLSPGLLPADAGEYQSTGALLGVAHPPGFALYTLLSWLATRVLFFLSPATAINALSALLAALTLALVSRTVQRLTNSVWAGWGAAAVLGFSTTFWAQAVIANIRMPTACATAWIVERVVAYMLETREIGELKGNSSSHHFPSFSALFALALGLGVAHHASLAFLATIFFGYVFILHLRQRWGQSLISNLQSLLPLGVAALPFLSWLYFPLRAGAYGAPPRIATLDGFLEHILAQGFAGDMLHFATTSALPDRVRVFGNILTFEFNWLVLALCVGGGVVALWRWRGLGVALLAALGLHSFIAITYRAPQTVEYLIPSYVLMAVLTGLALAQLISWLHHLCFSTFRFPLSLSPLLPITLAAILAFSQLIPTLPSAFAFARDNSTRQYAETLLHQAPQHSLVLASWHWATPLWYLQAVEGQRPDVEVRYVFAQAAGLGPSWVAAIQSALPQRPVIVTSFFPQEFGALPYRFVPLGEAWQVAAEPITVQQPLDAQTFGAWQFLGAQPPAQTARTVEVVTAWQTTAAPQDVNFFVHLVNVEGQLMSQMDVAYPAARYEAGEVLLNRFTLYLRPDWPAGDYALRAGAYLPDGTRLAEVPLGNLTLPAPSLALPANAIPLGSDLAYLARPLALPALPPGGALTVDLEFLGLRPIVHDYTVSLTLIGANWQWKTQSDHTPAEGMIPTLKWIAGSRVTDRHTLHIPADAAPGPAQLYLTVYDAFTQQPLPSLAPDLAEGTVLPLGVVEIITP